MLNAVSRDDLPDNAPALALSVRRISLAAFRNYDDLSLETGNAPIVLTGANGSGKTNLLEAVSLLLPGRGWRRAELIDLQNNDATEPWAVAAHLNTEFGDLQVGTGRDPQEVDGERRLVHIDGKNVRSQNALGEHIAMAWITPDMDRILGEGPGPRRKLLDRLVYSFDPAHGGRVNRYEKSLRERLRLLREGVADATWLNAL